VSEENEGVRRVRDMAGRVNKDRGRGCGGREDFWTEHNW
jgi:hypothetical protein